MSIPVVKPDEKKIPTLYVHDQPFFMRGGEIHNSSASDPVFLEEKLWPALRGMHMNSVIAPVYWELIEPAEGVYDFSSVETLIFGARKEGLKLCILWFGLWKNSESMYVPAWVKINPKTYFRTEKVSGKKMNTISPLCAAAVEKDHMAFTALLRHIREMSGGQVPLFILRCSDKPLCAWLRCP